VAPPNTANFSAASELCRRCFSSPDSAYNGTLAISTPRKTISMWLAATIRHIPSKAPSTSTKNSVASSSSGTPEILVKTTSSTADNNNSPRRYTEKAS